jgi:DNA-binding GntR family transcriptional regulator
MSATFADALFAPAVQQALHLQVYEALRRAIVRGALGPGQRVNEAEIARQMQISRAPVREAIRQLERDGLLASVPRRGTTVATLAPADVEEMFTLRADLEARATVRAVSRLDQDDLASLEGLLLRMATAGAAGDMAGLLDADIEFHRIIVEAADWPHLQQIWETLHPRTVSPHVVRALVGWSAREHAARHRAIIDALRHGDADAAAEVVRNHFLAVGAEILRCLPAISPTPDPEMAS